MNSRVASLIWKELLAVLKDPRSRISIFLPPIIQLLIFAYAATLDVTNVSIGILNKDAGEKGFELVQRFHGSTVFKSIHYLKAVEEIAPFIDRQKGLMVLSIDEQFSRDIDAKKKARVQFLFDGRKSNSAQILSGYATEIVSQYNKDMTNNLNVKQQNTILVPRNWFNPNVQYIWYNLPCLVAILSMFSCLVVTSQSIARERELGTFDQILVSPLTPLEILIGKTVPGIFVGMIGGAFMLAMAVFAFEVPFTGSLTLFFLSLFIFVTSISGVGLFISSLSATQQQALLGTFTFMMPAILLSGYATPIENMPTWLQPVSYLIPLKYMLIISKGIFLKAMPPQVILQNIWQVLLIGIFNLLGAGIFFRRRIQ